MHYIIADVNLDPQQILYLLTYSGDFLKNIIRIDYRVSHMYLNDFVRLFRGHWVT